MYNQMSSRCYSARKLRQPSVRKPHSEKSIDSSENPFAGQQEVKWLNNKLKYLKGQRNMTEQEANWQWKKASQHRTSNRAYKAQEANTMSKMKVANYISYNKRILKVQERLISLIDAQIKPLVKGNYLIMKVDETFFLQEDYFTKEKEQQQLENKLQILKFRANLAQQEADRHWIKAKQYEDSKQMDQALEAKEMYEKEMAHYRSNYQRICEIEDKVRKLMNLRIKPKKKEINKFTSIKLVKGGPY